VLFAKNGIAVSVGPYQVVKKIPFLKTAQKIIVA
jgi:hypothetical protein